jgi:hypothetical protein
MEEQLRDTAGTSTNRKFVSEIQNAYHNREGSRRARSTTVASEQATTTKHTVNLPQKEDYRMQENETKAMLARFCTANSTCITTLDPT